MKIAVFGMITALILSVIGGLIFIPILKKIRAGQTVLKYVTTHFDKNGTPTMAGLFFITAAAIAFFIFGGFENRIAVVSVTIGLAFLVVGFLDDFIKIKLKRNLGLKSYQKVIFQAVIAVFAGVFAYQNSLTIFYIPFSLSYVDLGAWSIPLIALIFIAITNSVNLTDGLDSLAGGVSVAYLTVLAVLIALEKSAFSYVYLLDCEYQALMTLVFCLIGAILGFLIFNVNKARVFMGDAGSLSLGGFIGAISLFSFNGFFIPVIGIMFVLSSISVIMQVVRFKISGKRFFLMAPIHHHFQLKGYTETQISYCYILTTLIVGALVLAVYL